MQGENSGKTTIIGGVYKECCAMYESSDLYGSGLRALAVFQHLDGNAQLTFISCCHDYQKIVRALYDYPNTTLSLFDSSDITFYYEHPFRVSRVTPRSDLLYYDRKLLRAESDNILIFGMIDADFCVKGHKIVYDPQTCVQPLSFIDSGSKAEQLVLCLNAKEAAAISNQDEILKQRDYIFKKEGCYALVIKNGTHGATLFKTKNDEGIYIPVYKTHKVHSIGTGDVFSSYIAYYWFHDVDIVDAAILASKAVACYSETGKINLIQNQMRKFDFEPLRSNDHKQIYLAGPFFSYAQRWLVNEFYGALLQEGATVFSPLHDVGYGNAEEVTHDDLKGLEKSGVILAIVDGLDSGTLFEVGYAVALGKKIVAYYQTESSKALQMLEGTGCDIEDDFATAVYKAIWYASE